MNYPDNDRKNFRRKLASGFAGVFLLVGVALLASTISTHFPGEGSLRDGAPGETLTAAPRASAATESSEPDGKVLPAGLLAPQTPFDSIPPSIEQRPVSERASRDFDRLFAIVPPIHDYYRMTQELSGREIGQRLITRATESIGDRAIFQTKDGPRQAELVYRDDLAAYWIETGLTIDREALRAAAERLRNTYYPMLNRTIGVEWNPGVDGDSLFTVLHVLGAPDTVELGYFIDENQYPRTLFSQSNEREMIYLNMTRLAQGPLYDGTLVHEVQHLIQWNMDANEDKWFNEALSQLAETMAGLDTVDPHPYLEQTNIRLDNWPDNSADILPHYAAGYLYLLYFWEQLGDAALIELARHPANGLAAARSVLSGHNPSFSLEYFTADWATALYLDGKTSDPRYNIEHHTLTQPFFADRARQFPYETVSSIEQYAIDYIDLDFTGPATLTFAGDTVVELVDPPPDGELIWYAPPSNSSQAQLTAAVDLSGVSNASLSFMAWYDLEQEYDFAYLSVSGDGGLTWKPLESVHGQLGPYGPAWGGTSKQAVDSQNGWIRELIDLDEFVGQSILLRFDVLTDFDKFGRGFALTDLAISQINEQPNWQPNGFIETGVIIPQKWELRLIRDGRFPEIVPLTLDTMNRAQVSVDPGPEGGVLVIMPLTPFTNGAAEYWLSITR